MLNDDLIELYYLVTEENKIKKDIAQLKNSLTDIKDNIEEVKASITNGLTNINHKYAKYKNMIVTLGEKPERFKLKTEELCDVIEDIINMDLDTTEKREKILPLKGNTPPILPRFPLALPTLVIGPLLTSKF